MSATSKWEISEGAVVLPGWARHLDIARDQFPECGRSSPAPGRREGSRGEWGRRARFWGWSVRSRPAGESGHRVLRMLLLLLDAPALGLRPMGRPGRGLTARQRLARWLAARVWPAPAGAVGMQFQGDAETTIRAARMDVLARTCGGETSATAAEGKRGCAGEKEAA